MTYALNTSNKHLLIKFQLAAMRLIRRTKLRNIFIVIAISPTSVTDIVVMRVAQWLFVDSNNYFAFSEYSHFSTVWYTIYVRINIQQYPIVFLSSGNGVLQNTFQIPGLICNVFRLDLSLDDSDVKFFLYNLCGFWLIDLIFKNYVLYSRLCIRLQCSTFSRTEVWNPNMKIDSFKVLRMIHIEFFFIFH